MNFIKNIFDQKIDSETHFQFQKFSRGIFKNRALINAKKRGKKYTISTSPEFAFDFVQIMAKKLGTEITKVTGCIVSTQDLTGIIDFKNKKQFQGVKRYIIEKELSGEDILQMTEKIPKAFFALSFSTTKENSSLKIKPKAPKTGKPNKKEDKPKANFCKLITEDERIARDFVFEVSEFKDANISHDFIIEKIEIPEELKKTNDFVKIREESKRIGKIIRHSEIDGKNIKKEIEFRA